MSIFVDKNTRLLVQGITGKEGQFHARQCIDYGTNVVAGVTPGKGGQKMDDVPVFNTVKEAVGQTGANCSMVFVPPAFAADAIMEGTDAGVDLTALASRLHLVCDDGLDQRGQTHRRRFRQGEIPSGWGASLEAAIPHQVWTWNSRLAQGRSFKPSGLVLPLRCSTRSKSRPKTSR